MLDACVGLLFLQLEITERIGASFARHSITLMEGHSMIARAAYFLAWIS